MKSLQVAIIGASAERGWAKESHVPAVQQLEGMELAAVAVKGQDKADAAARAFGAKRAYGDVSEVFRDPAVDIVAICVKAPDHRELVLAALAAGKNVYCEWPLGRDTAETELLSDAAVKAGVHVALGLQTRANPVVARARQLIASGSLGRLLAARVESSTIAFGDRVDAAELYTEDPRSGVSLVTIQGAHTLDVVVAILGPLADLAALTTTQFPEITVKGEVARRRRTIADHLLVGGRLAGGAALSLEVAGGRSTGTFRFEAIGESGSLRLQGGAARGFQAGRLRLTLDGDEERVDEGELAALPDAAANVAGIYAALRDDIQRQVTTAPDFAHGIRLARLVDDVTVAGRHGAQRAAADWPIT